MEAALGKADLVNHGRITQDLTSVKILGDVAMASCGGAGHLCITQDLTSVKISGDEAMASCGGAGYLCWE